MLANGVQYLAQSISVKLICNSHTQSRVYRLLGAYYHACQHDVTADLLDSRLQLVVQRRCGLGASRMLDVL